MSWGWTPQFLPTGAWGPSLRDLCAVLRLVLSFFRILVGSDLQEDWEGLI